MKLLKKGDKGDEVIFLQRLLRKLIFGAPSIIDGDFGIQTEATVRNFQKSNGLPQDGVVGDRSWNMLFAKADATTILGTDIYHGDETEDTKFYDDLEKNYWFCFAKSSQGASMKDVRFGEHFQKLKAHTILRGAYHFFRFPNTDIDAEIDNFLMATKNAGIVWSEKGVLPPVLDIEPIGKEFNPPFKSQIIADRAHIVARAKKWLTVVEAKTGKRPIIYTTRLIWDEFLKSPAGFEKYSLWVADYGNLPAPRLPSTWKSYMMWQFSEKGKIGGKAGFDLNNLNISLGDLLKLAGY